MKRIKTDQLQQGMTLAQDIILPNGTIFFAKDEVLKTEHIHLLQRRNIMEVAINDLDIATEPSAVPLPHQEKPDSSITESTAQPPEIRIRIASDNMSAHVKIISRSTNSGSLSFEYLLQQLQSQGISYGIQTEKLRANVDLWNHSPQLHQIPNAAIGQEPHPGVEEFPRMKMRHLTKKPDVENVQKAQYAWEVSEIIGQAQRVEPGMAIAARHWSTPPQAGISVKEETVMPKNTLPAFILGDGAAYSDDELFVISQVCGIAYAVENKIGVIPLNFDGSLELIISPDKLKADLIVHPCGESGSMPSYSIIQSLLEQYDITFGINSETVQKLVSDLSKNQITQEQYTIAEGTPPENGEHGRIELRFNTETSLKPQPNKDGSVDFKNVNILHSVTKGQTVAIQIAPSKGTPGKAITGTPIACNDGTPAPLPVGLNTAIDPNDATKLIAQMDGIIKYDGATVSIEEGFIVPGDVDYSTGHLKYQKSIIVKGDVKAGFNVECGSNLEVSGIIEDCTIVAGGNVLCRLGFIGQGKGQITAKGDVNIGFMKNQTVKCGRDASIAREVINSTIYARKRILIHGHPLSVAGGTLMARDAIHVYAVGNNSGIRTDLEVGIDFTLIDELQKTENQIDEVSKGLKKIRETLQKCDQMASIRSRTSDNTATLMAKCKEGASKYEERLRALEERKKNILSQMYNIHHACIHIEHSAMPGTILKIGERHYLIKEPLIGPKTIRSINHEIRIV